MSFYDVLVEKLKGRTSLSTVLQCFAMFCHVLPYFAMLCHVLPCFAMFCPPSSCIFCYFDIFCGENRVPFIEFTHRYKILKRGPKYNRSVAKNGAHLNRAKSISKIRNQPTDIKLHCNRDQTFHHKSLFY